MTKVNLEYQVNLIDLQEVIYEELVNYGKSNEIYFDIMVDIIVIGGERKVSRSLSIFRRFMKGREYRLKDISMELSYFFERELNLGRNKEVEVYMAISPYIE